VESLPISIVRQDGAILMTCRSCEHLWKVITREPLPPNCANALAVFVFTRVMPSWPVSRTSDAQTAATVVNRSITFPLPRIATNAGTRRYDPQRLTMTPHGSREKTPGRSDARQSVSA